MIVYNKLIRDKIPEIIEAQGKQCDLKILEDVDYLNYLNHKLQEELDEYNTDGNITELADLVEVVYAILQHKQLSVKDFEQIRLEKKKTRGGFERKLLLVSVSE